MPTTTTTTGATNRTGSVFIGLATNSQLGNVSLGASPMQDFGLAAPAATGNYTFKYITNSIGLPDAADLQTVTDINTGNVLQRASSINKFTSYRDEPKDFTTLGNANISYTVDGLYDSHQIGDLAGTLYKNYPLTITAVTPATDNEAVVGYGSTGGYVVNFGTRAAPSGGTH